MDVVASNAPLMIKVALKVFYFFRGLLALYMNSQGTIFLRKHGARTTEELK